jgi:hypothetical protein
MSSITVIVFLSRWDGSPVAGMPSTVLAEVGPVPPVASPRSVRAQPVRHRAADGASRHGADLPGLRRGVRRQWRRRVVRLTSALAEAGLARVAAEPHAPVVSGGSEHLTQGRAEQLAERLVATGVTTASVIEWFLAVSAEPDVSTFLR